MQLDYVKWRGILFLRFLVALVDESEKIRQLADFLFGNILKGMALIVFSRFLYINYIIISFFGTLQQRLHF